MSEEKPLIFKKGGRVWKGHASCYGSLPASLRMAKLFSGKEGHIASLPELVEFRTHKIWPWRGDSIKAMSEEDIFKTPHGNSVIAVIHGGGILSTPERIQQAYNEGLVHGAAKLSEEETARILAGKEMPVYPFSEFKKGIKELPRRYTIILDFDTSAITVDKPIYSTGLRHHPLIIARCGGVEQTERYMDRACEEYADLTIREGPHQLKSFDPEQRQGRLLQLGNNPLNHIQSHYSLDYCHDFLWIVPEGQDAKPRLLEEMLVLGLDLGDVYVPSCAKAQYRRQLLEGMIDIFYK